jgi:hypothetical protein
VIQTSHPNPFDSSEATPEAIVASRECPSTIACVVALEHGLHAIEIGESARVEGRAFGLQAPAVQVSGLPGEQGRHPRILCLSGCGDAWFDREGGTAIVNSPPGGARVLVTVYGPPQRTVSIPNIRIRRLDPCSLNGDLPKDADPAGAPAEIRSEIILHVERLGDRHFAGEGWAGNRGKKLRIEAFSIRPMDTLLARDIEFKAMGPKGRQTPWVTDAKLCGTRGQGLPLTGFAIRPAPHAAESFDITYRGAFFESGIVGPFRNGELCIPPVADDPLEAIEVRLTNRTRR